MLLRRFHHPPHAQEDEQVEERIDDSRVEVECRQQRSSIDNAPEDAHAVGVQACTDAVEHEHRDDSEECIREACGKLIDAEDLHAEHLEPDEDRGLLVERTEIDLHVHVVARHDHLACALSEVHLVPVEQSYAP